ncbi:MAG: hypothetical protein SF123_15770 [Chloroflexota bacterium]|nr:hypothetical protein [Chloroflexota bacterium]
MRLCYSPCASSASREGTRVVVQRNGSTSGEPAVILSRFPAAKKG